MIFHPDLGDEVSRRWYEEIEHWSFRTHSRKETSPSNAHTGYFTAMLWRDTTRFGIGLSEYRGKLFIVARYYPHPNTIGEFEDNVQPLKDINDMYDGKSMQAKTYDTEDIITLFELKANNVKRPGYLNIRAGECFRPAIKCSIKDLIEINTSDKLKLVIRRLRER